MGSSKASYGVMGLCAVMMAMMIMGSGVAGQGPTAAPDCDTVVLSLADCLSFVMGAATTPPPACCSNLSAVIATTPQCLCQLYNSTFTGPLNVNITLAQQLPPACKLTTPDPSLCSAFGIPVAAPVSSSGPVVAPSPMAPSPTSTAPSSLMTPTAAPPVAPAPAGSIVPVGSPGMELPPAGSVVPAGSPNASNSSTPSPNSAPSFSGYSGVAAGSLLLALALFLQ